MRTQPRFSLGLLAGLHCLTGAIPVLYAIAAWECRAYTCISVREDMSCRNRGLFWSNNLILLKLAFQKRQHQTTNLTIFNLLG